MWTDSGHFSFAEPSICATPEGEFDEKDAAPIAAVVSRLGVADVRAFGLAWDDCEDLLQQLGFSARVEIVTP